MSPFFQRIKDRFEPISFLIAFVATLLGAAVYVGVFVNDTILETVNNRIKPYENYMAANSLFINDSPDRCMNILAPIMREIDSDQYSTIDKEPFYDLTIACARDSSTPGDHASIVRQIEVKLENGQIRSSPWHWGALGWFHLKMGDAEGARRFLERAIPLFSAEGDHLEEGDSRWGMTVVYLLEAKPAEALREYEEAARLNPERFNLTHAERPIVAQLNSRQLSRLRSNANMRRSLPAFLRELQNLNRQGGRPSNQP